MTPEVRTALCPTANSAFSFDRVTRAIALSAAVVLPALALAPSAMAQITPTVTNTIPFFTAPATGSVFAEAISADGSTLYVTNQSSGSTAGALSTLDISTGTIGAVSGTVGGFPLGLAFNHPASRAYVTNLNDSTVSVLGLSKLATQQTLDVSGNAALPYSVVYDGGHILISSIGGSNIVPEYGWQTPLALFKNIPIPGSTAKAAVVPENPAYASGNGNPTARNLGNKIAIPVFYPSTTSISGGVPRLFFVNPTTGTLFLTLSLEGSTASPEDVVISPDGHYAYVSLFDTLGGTGGGVWVVNLHTLETVTVIPTEDFANYGEALSADGKYLLVTGFSDGEVALIDTTALTLDYIIQVGNNPFDVAVTADGSTAFVTNESDGTVSQIAFSPNL
jgi:DNA-binding beta-propeller fold protein YncE